MQLLSLIQQLHLNYIKNYFFDKKVNVKIHFEIQKQEVILMKKVILGGFLFVGGAIMFSVGILGIADVNVAAYYMKMPQYTGIIAMIAGIVLGVLGMKDEK